MKKLKFPTKYDPHKVGKSFKNVKGCADPQFRDMCSVDAIIKRYGILPKPTVDPCYADVSDITDYQTSFERVKDMSDYFSSLPSDMRDRFRNSPMEFFAWLADPSNYAEAVKMGLMKDNAPSKAEQLLGEIAENTKVTAPAAT